MEYLYLELIKNSSNQLARPKLFKQIIDFLMEKLESIEYFRNINS